jgi:hypothetical protein
LPRTLSSFHAPSLRRTVGLLDASLDWNSRFPHQCWQCDACVDDRSQGPSLMARADDCRLYAAARAPLGRRPWPEYQAQRTPPISASACACGYRLFELCFVQKVDALFAVHSTDARSTAPINDFVYGIPSEADEQGCRCIAYSRCPTRTRMGTDAIAGRRRCWRF